MRYNSAETVRRIREARKEAGLSQEEMGRKLGLTDAGYGHYERERIQFTVEQIFLLARILGRSAGYFLGIDCGLTPDEDELLVAYRTARSKGLGSAALNTVKALSKAGTGEG